jgi:hypothetical protein
VKTGEPGDPTWCVCFVFLGAWQDQTDGGDKQNSGKDVADPFEVSEETYACGDEGSAHEDGAEDAPEEGLGLMGGFDFEEAEEEEKEEEVVDGERLFDGVACEVLGSRQASHGTEDEEGEGKSSGDPEGGGGYGGGLSFGGALVTNVKELGPEEDEDEQVKTYPMTNGGRKHLTSMLHGSIRRLFVRENWARVFGSSGEV